MIKKGCREFMDHAPDECIEKARKEGHYSSEITAECLLRQQNDQEICRKCPQNIIYIWAIGYEQGMKEGTKARRKQMRDKPPLLCRIRAFIAPSSSAIFKGCAIGCGGVWNKNCQSCPEYTVNWNWKEDDASGEVQEVHLDGGDT